MARVLRGIAAAPGRVAAPVWRWRPVVATLDPVDLKGADALDRLQAAIAQVSSRLSATVRLLQEQHADAEGEILGAQALMLEDPAFLQAAVAHIQEGLPADRAVEQALEPYALMLEQSSDPVFQARAADVRDVTEQLRRALHGSLDRKQALPDTPSILVASDLAPSETAALDRERVVGFVTEQGSATAHTAILARALGLPAVVGLSGVLEAVTDGDTVLIDGDEGILLIDPPAAARDAAKLDRTLQTDREPARTRDGKLIEVGCNVDSVHDAVRAAQAGADGVGLLRTEFLFLGRERLPTEDEQVAILKEVLRPMRGRPIVLRTLDVGADKPLPSLPQPAEANPALGVRGLRLQLHRRPDLLEDQLRAAIRLSREHILRVMFPMVSTVGELRAARKVLDQALGGTTGQERVPFQVGVMIEVPAAALAADALAAEADFFSLGTNDLVQYTFAADRTNPALAELADFLHPVILRLIGSVAAAAHKHQRWVGICGEMASNPWALPLLVGLGLDELSIHPPLVARVKQRVRGLDAGECALVAQEAAALEDGGAVRELLRSRRLGP